MTDPTYSLYPVLAQVQNCPIVGGTLPLLDDWTLPGEFARNMNEAQVKLTFLVNPMPTGSFTLSAWFPNSPPN
ncbi:MAG: hypothetical protein ACNYPE_04645 [Candidatus Azotimanducaceae bacterium WSBS_2022_MAG_OTU7]